MRLARNPRDRLTGSASMITPLLSRSAESWSESANTGISVSNAFVGSLSSNLKSFLKRPSTVAPSAEMRSTLPLLTSSRKVGLYGIRTDSTFPGANIATKM
jgi:hypothetical protein